MAEKKPVETDFNTLTINVSVETVKQFILIGSGFCAAIFTGFAAMQKVFTAHPWLIVFPVVAAICFVISIGFGILFLLAVLARTAVHRDADIMQPAPKRDMKYTLFTFWMATAVLLIGAIVFSIVHISVPNPTIGSGKIEVKTEKYELQKDEQKLTIHDR